MLSVLKFCYKEHKYICIIFKESYVAFVCKINFSDKNVDKVTPGKPYQLFIHIDERSTSSDNFHNYVNLLKNKTRKQIRLCLLFVNVFTILNYTARGAYVNVMNGVGCTPLHDAVKRKDLQVVKELLSYGADPSIKVKNRYIFNIDSLA